MPVSSGRKISETNEWHMEKKPVIGLPWTSLLGFLLQEKHFDGIKKTGKLFINRFLKTIFTDSLFG